MPKGPQKFHFAFKKSGLTGVGGVSLLRTFCRVLRCYCMYRLLGSHQPTETQRNPGTGNALAGGFQHLSTA
jgi:hypothetical protein